MPRHARPLHLYRPATRELVVRDVVDLTPGMRRVVLTGPELGAHTGPDGVAVPAFTSTGFDDDVRLLFPRAETPRSSSAAASDTDPATAPRRPIAKAYTVRRFDAGAAEVHLDVVRHGVGVATTWAQRAHPGDCITVAGPSLSRGLPTDGAWLLIMGDETALPAIARLMEELPRSARAQVFIEVADPTHRQPLAAPDGAQVTWLSRDHVEPGTTDLLLEAVRSTIWWEGAAFAWIAGEQTMVQSVRRHLIDDRGMDRSAVDFSGYWRRSKVVGSAADPAMPDPDRSSTAVASYLAQRDPLPAVAIRAAVNLGVAERLADGACTLVDLAAATGTHERSLETFLHYLSALGYVRSVDQRWHLDEKGELLASEYARWLFDPNGVPARQEQSLQHLVESLQTGDACHRSMTGASWAEQRGGGAFLGRVLDDAARYAHHRAVGIAASPMFSTATEVTVHSDVASTLADALTAAHPDLQVVIAALPSAASWFTADLAASVPERQRSARITVLERSVLDPAPAATTVLLDHALTERSDADAAMVLRRAADVLARGGQLIMIEPTVGATPGEYAARTSLLGLAVHGVATRTEEQLAAVVTAAGLTIGSTLTGHGATLRLLETVPV